MDSKEIFYKLSKLVIVAVLAICLTAMALKAGFMPTMFKMNIDKNSFNIEVSGQEKNAQPLQK